MLDPVLFDINSGLEERVNIGQWNHRELLNYKLLEEWASSPGPPSTVKYVAKILNLEKYQPVYPQKNNPTHTFCERKALMFEET